MKCVIAEADKPNKNGHIYTTQSLEDIVAKHTTSVLGVIGMTTCFSIDTNNMSHKIDNLRMEGGKLVGDAIFLDTPQGKILQLISSEVEYRTAGTASFEADGKTIKDFTLISINAVSRDTAA